MIGDSIRQEAARMIRDRARAARGRYRGPWAPFTKITVADDSPRRAAGCAQHVALWSPLAAMRMADLIECPCEPHAIAAAQTWTGDA